MRILIADDHPLYLESVNLRLQRLYPQAAITEANDLDGILAVAPDDPVHLILLDFRMPGMNGLSGIVRTRERFPKAPIVMISGQASPADVTAAIQAGARGFLAKTMPAEAFSLAISLVMAGGTYVPSEALDAPADDKPAGGGTTASDLERLLTPRERQVLVGLVTGASNKELARQFELVEVTIKLHVRQILKKIGARNRAEAAAMAARAGLI